jgi:hypothetical protein
MYLIDQTHDVLPFAWPKVFLLTNEKQVRGKECSVVVVFTARCIPMQWKIICGKSTNSGGV